MLCLHYKVISHLNRDSVVVSSYGWLKYTGLHTQSWEVCWREYWRWVRHVTKIETVGFLTLYVFLVRRGITEMFISFRVGGIQWDLWEDTKSCGSFLVYVHVLVLWLTDLIGSILFLLINSDLLGLLLCARVQAMDQNVRVFWSLVELSLLNVAFECVSEINVLCFNFFWVFSTGFDKLIVESVFELASNSVWAVAIELELSAHLGFVIDREIGFHH